MNERGTCEKYIVELVWASGVLGRKYGKSCEPRKGRTARDEEMDRLAGFMRDRGSYP